MRIAVAIGCVVLFGFACAPDTAWAKKTSKAKAAKRRHRLIRPRYWLKQYDCQRFQLVVVYDPGRGSTDVEVRRRLRAAYVAGGGYYTWRTPQDARAVDLVVVPRQMVGGQIVGYQRVAYRSERRPVVQIGEANVTIAPIASGQRLSEATIAAIAVDHQPRDPARSTWREVIAVKGNRVLLFKFRDATQRYCERILKRYGIRQVDFAYLDGGRAVSRPGYDPRKPNHLAVVPRRQ